MGAAKGEPQDEEVPTPTKEATVEAAVEGEKQRYMILIVYILLALLNSSGLPMCKKIF